mgnify:CR=1 FL=1
MAISYNSYIFLYICTYQILSLQHPLWPINEPNSITAWTPLSIGGSTLQGGALGYVPGSHRAGKAYFSNIVSGTDQEIKEREQSLLKTYAKPPTFVEVPEGGVAFHHGMTTHLSMPNQTTSDRPAFTTAFVADGCTRGSLLGNMNQKHPMVDRPLCEIGKGEKLVSKLTPLAHPRPLNQPIERPPPLTIEAYMASQGSMPAPPGFFKGKI